jgi:BCD family chlorophyll transporter-like MFS transporter
MAQAGSQTAGLGWLGIVKLGLVQSAIGAVAALTTSTLNRVTIVEAGMPAMLPAALVAWHYVVQLSRPHWGHGSDQGQRRTPFIIGGMSALSLGAILATDAVTMLHGAPVVGMLLGLVAYSMIGAGMGAAGTSLLALLATRVAPERRPAAASITWVMMILGIVLSASITGALLTPFTAQRLAMIASGVAGIAFLLTLLAVWRVEDGPEITAPARPDAPKASFNEVLHDIWSDPVARNFTVFVFVSMLAYSAQELILEPFAGLVFAMTPGQSAQLSGLQHGGVLLGMVTVGVLGARFGDRRSQWMRLWTVGGCLGSAVALAGLGAATAFRPVWPLAPTVFGLGFANGVFAVSAIGSMMGLAGGGRSPSAGARMGVWGAAQAGAFAIGGFLGAAGSDALRKVLHDPASAFLGVFAVEALIFLASAALAAGISTTPRASTNTGQLTLGGAGQ